MANHEKSIIVTPPATASFTHLNEPYSESGKYQVNLIFEPGADLSALEAEVDRVAKAKWPKGLPKKFAHPIKDCSEKVGLAGYNDDGSVFIVAKSVNKPKVFSAQKERLDDASSIYAGAIIRASVTAFAYETKGNVGVSLGLVNIQKLRDGTPFSGVTTDGDELDAVEEDLSDVL